MPEVHREASRKTAGMTVLGMLAGGTVGGLLGAVLRGGMTFYNLREGAEFGLLASHPSAGIGFLCGAVAGAFCRGWLGALLGAFLSGGVFALFVLPFAYVAALFNATSEVTAFSWPFLLQKIMAGALAGGGGGILGSFVVLSERPRRPRIPDDEPLFDD